MGAEGNVYRMQTQVFIKLFKSFLPTKTKCCFPIIRLEFEFGPFLIHGLVIVCVIKPDVDQMCGHPFSTRHQISFVMQIKILKISIHQA